METSLFREQGGASSSATTGCLHGLSFALDLGLGTSFKAKQEINRLITTHGGRVSYMINRKVRRH